MTRFVFALIVGALSGCADNGLADTTWQVTRVGATSASNLTIGFGADGAYVFRGGSCSAHGTYDTDGDQFVVVTGPFSTREACLNETGFRELVVGFGELTHWSASPLTLELRGDDVVVVAKPR